MFNDRPAMQRRYTVENGGKFGTVNSCAGPVGVAVQCCNLQRNVVGGSAGETETKAQATIAKALNEFDKLVTLLEGADLNVTGG